MSSRLDLCAIVETWHDSADSTQLIGCAPPGFRYIENARQRTEAKQQTTHSNHGGVCLFYASHITAREVPLPVYKSGLEVLAVYTRGARRNALVTVLYWPGSKKVNNAFFDDLADVFERTSTFACPVVFVGDINIHLDVATDPDTVKFMSLIDSQGLIQHVSSPTHREGHLLDVFMTRSDCPVTALYVEPPMLSDHSFITATVDLQFGHGPPITTIRRRKWRQFNFAKFCDDLNESALLRDPPVDAAGLFLCYNETLQSLVDKHAPFADVRLHAHPNAPWYDAQCRAVKVKIRKLERAYRHHKSAAGLKAWRHQSSYMRHLFQRRYREYWRAAISDNAKDSKALWSKISALLKAPEAPSSTTMHTADAFAEHFRAKVDGIRTATSSAAQPVIDKRQCTGLETMREVTTEEITTLVNRAPVKHCALDPAPTWLVKRLLPHIAGTISLMCNASLAEGVFPSTLKQAIVKPRLKKPTLNPDDLNSYRPISNLSFISKVVERVVVARLNDHFVKQDLLPCRQSAYRANHSTETAIVAVYDEIVRAVDSGNMCVLVLLDLSSAFDTVDHDTLLQVLNRRFGVDGLALAWCTDYLSDRTQTFQAGSLQSGPHAVNCSVPQGSVLGPKKFIAYTEDLVTVIDRSELGHHLYADDTQLIKSVGITEIQRVIAALQNCILDIHSWCASRRLQLNPSKTEVIWFGSRASLHKAEDTDRALRVGSDVIQPVSSVRDLGVILDEELTMKKHISKMTSVAFQLDTS